MTRTAGALCALLLAAACASTAPTQPAYAQSNPMAHSMNSIQPETTISLSGNGTVDREPDIATVNVGVEIEAETAAQAMEQQAERMNAVFDAVRAAGVANRDMQTSSLSLNPVYDYNRPDNRPRLRGYSASNQITILVRDLDNLGASLDAIVRAGSNQINSVQFGVDDPTEATDEARVAAIADARRKADLYAEAAGYRVARIVTISEGGGYSPPMPMAARMVSAEAAPTPIAQGEVSLTANVNVTFELVK